ncbi:hypothetical protein EYF80_008194 [Liparis tanakae]|uniref:Uncharacterized protein n=1 Tax=Liparis tanakae TaxID=230148 RepID=A0A4Z2IVY1_9TELE|nr:hypothetical protein EYF80_008194 [Liparis tanakae]
MGVAVYGRPGVTRRPLLWQWKVTTAGNSLCCLLQQEMNEVAGLTLQHNTYSEHCPFKDCHMDSPRQVKNLNREPKRNQNPPQKDAYGRLLNQHSSSKFSQYLEQYAKDATFQKEGNGPSTLPKAQSDMQNIPQRQRDQLGNDLSVPGDSSKKGKGEESTLSLYMEKLSTRSPQQDFERKQGVSDRQRWGQRRDTATSHDGDVESGEELGSLNPNESKKHLKQQKKAKDSNKDVASKETDSSVGCPQSPNTAGTSGQEPEKIKKAKKKKLLRHPEEDRSGEGTFPSGVDTQTPRPKSPFGKDKKLQQPRGKL